MKNGKLPGDRTIGEILESLREGEIPSHEECYWALLAVANRLAYTESSILRTEEIMKATDPSITLVLENLFWTAKDSESFKKATAKEYLGGGDVDKNFREMSKTIVEKAIREQYE